MYRPFCDVSIAQLRFTLSKNGLSAWNTWSLLGCFVYVNEQRLCREKDYQARKHIVQPKFLPNAPCGWNKKLSQHRSKHKNKFHVSTKHKKFPAYDSTKDPFCRHFFASHKNKKIIQKQKRLEAREKIKKQRLRDAKIPVWRQKGHIELNKDGDSSEDPSESENVRAIDLTNNLK